ncbi:MAG: sulfotransferase [Cyclobacteriaceae bacterium]
MNQKVFCIGFNKTGTTSLHAVFSDQLGLDSVHKTKWVYWSADKGKSRTDEYDAFSDGEAPLIKNLLKKYPDAYFILNTRPLKSWLISRHKAAQRSKEAVTTILSEVLPLGWVANLIVRFHFKNDEKSMKRWIQIRNSYHRYAVDLLSNHDRFLLINIESENLHKKLKAFLNLKQDLKPTWANLDGKGHEKVSTALTIIEALGNEINQKDSKQAVETFLDQHNISNYADEIRYFHDPHFNLSKSISDRITTIAPFLTSVFQNLFTYSVVKRGKARNFLSKWYYDKLIGWSRSEKYMDRYCSIHYHI